jgi:hypothetical protein
MGEEAGTESCFFLRRKPAIAIDRDWGSAWVVETEEAIKQRTETVIEVAYGTMPS